MTTRLVTGGRLVEVALEPDGAVVDGETVRLTDVRVGPRAATAGATVQEVAALVDGRPCLALVARLPDRVLVALDGRVHAFAREETARAAGGHPGGSGVVTAPMPGKVVAVLVAAGDTVEAGQPIAIVEAMKMETTLVAEIAGRVERLDAVPGQLVDAGRVIATIAAA